MLGKFFHKEGMEIINSRDSTVFDFMPYKLGHQFKIDPILNKTIYLKAPVRLPFFEKTKAYEELCMHYLDNLDSKETLRKALEAYKYSLDDKMRFVISSFQEEKKYYPQFELDFMNFDNDVRKKLIRHYDNLDDNEKRQHTYWLHQIRETKNNSFAAIQGEKSLLNNIKYCLEKKLYTDAENLAKMTGDNKVMQEVYEQIPETILDTGFFEKFFKKDEFTTQ